MNKTFAVKNFMDAAKHMEEVRDLEEQLEKKKDLLKKNIAFFTPMLSKSETNLIDKVYGLGGQEKRGYFKIAKETRMTIEDVKSKEARIYDRICSIVLPYFDDFVDKVCA